jgi:5'-nucleotidase / UDP-sugar diphosphatase
MARIISFAIGAIAAMLFCMPGRSLAAVANISVLYTGDTHGHLKSFIYDSVKPVGGVAKRAIYFQDRRKHAKMNWLMLDSGNAISGTPLSDIFQGYIDIEAMNRLGYDAMALGEHEFDYGVGVLKQRISEAKFPVLCANVTYTDTGKPFTKPYTIIERDGVKIAIIGLITGDLDKRVAPENFTGLSVADPIETARVLIPQLQQQAELIFCLTHLGVNEDIKLATQVPGINLVVGGMSNSELQDGIYALDALIVQAGMFGRNVGQLKLSFEHGDQGRLKMRFCQNELVLMDGRYADNSNYVSWLNSFQPQFQEKMGTLVGNSAARMDNRMVGSFETELGNYVCDVLKDSLGADAALLPASFFNSAMPNGVITLGDLFMLMPYDHYGVVVNVTGAELQQVMNEAANNLGKPGFSQVSGVSYDLYGGKAYEVAIGDQKIDPYGRYKLATSDYLATGALGYATLGTVSDVHYSGRLIRDMVRQHLASGQVANAAIYKRIRLVASAPEAGTVAETTPEPQPPAGERSSPPPASDETASPPPAEQPAAQTPTEQPASGQPSSGEAGTPSDSTRYDRNGEPMTDQPAIKDEVITDTGSDLPAAEQPPAEQPQAQPPAETPSASTQPPSGATSGETIGRAQASKNGLDYEFFLVQTDRGYEFHLNVSNHGTEPVQLDFPTSERFDFQAYSGTDLLWSYNTNRFFVQSQQSDTVAPGETLTYRGEWNGLTNEKLPLPAVELHFVATHSISGAPVELSFNARLQK